MQHAGADSCRENARSEMKKRKVSAFYTGLFGFTSILFSILTTIFVWIFIQCIKEAADSEYDVVFVLALLPVVLKQPHPAGSPCTIALGRGGSYGAFLENSGPQFVWNALYRRTALLGLRFNERCSYGLEDFVFNAAAYRRVGKAVYIPQVVYRHFESAQSTSCAHTAQALLGRIRALEPWMEAEFHAAQRWCGPEELQAVWKDRRAQAVTFLMHQLRDAHAPGVLRRKAWRTLREALAPYPGSLLDTLHDAGHNKKQTMALLLYQMRLQKLYDLLPVREEQL